MNEKAIKRGTIWWVDLPPPEDSEPEDRHPILILQINDFNRTSVRTIIGVVITSNVHRADDPGNVRVEPGADNGLSCISVVNVSQVVTFDKVNAIERIGRLGEQEFQNVVDGVKLWLGFQ